MEFLARGIIATDRIDPNKDYELGNVLAPQIPGIDPDKTPEDEQRIAYPEKGVTLYYGYVSTTSSMACAFEYFVLMNLQVHSVSVIFDFDDLPEGESSIGLDALPSLQVLYMDRLKQDVMDRLKYYVAECVIGANEEGEVELLSTSETMEMIALRPRVLDYVWTQKEFNHLHVMVYQVTEEGQLSNRATVFRKGRLGFDEETGLEKVFIHQYPQVEISLPDWLPD